MNIIGLDIGTTSICGIAVDISNGSVKKVINAANSYSIAGRQYEDCQDPDGILKECIKMIGELLETCSPVCGIGVTGQMHGALYLDAEGKPLSPLYTWQDSSGNESAEDGIPYVQTLSSVTGYHMATGFGLSTLYVHTKQSRVPEKAACLCTIHDFVAMSLAGRKRPVMHTSDAKSFGIFDSGSLTFDLDAIRKAGLDPALLPEISRNCVILGEYNGIPVANAIGDNQASFAGSVRDPEASVLVNIGTGSQISFLSRNYEPIKSTELRPLFGDQFIRAGSALCGGRAFSVLEKFIRATVNLTDTKIGNAYPVIDALLASGCEPENPLIADTRFSGTRDDPSLTGSIQGITTENFTPDRLIYAVLHGMVDELYTMYEKCRDGERKYVVASGNGVRKNKALQRIITNTFGMELLIPSHHEEAAFGSAVYALSALNGTGVPDARSLIKYEQEL